MDWEVAIEKNHGALRRILAMLIAMVEMNGAGGQSSAGDSLLSFRRKAARLQAKHWRKKVNCPRHLLFPVISTVSCSACCVRRRRQPGG